MKGVEIHDMHPRGYLSFDLQEVLACLHEQVAQRTWRIENLECTGDASEVLRDVADRGGMVSGPELIRLSRQLNQVIDGTFFGSAPGEDSAGLIVQAVDSSFWQVFGDESCLRCVQVTFRDVRNVGYEV